MGRTGRVDFGRVFACVFVVTAHLAFFWVVTRKIVLPVPAGDADEALQVTWIEPPPPSAPPASAAASRVDAPQSVPQRAPAAPPATVKEDTVAPSDRAPMSAVFIEQGRQLSHARIQADAFAPDPLAHHAVKLPGAGNDTFRMRTPISAERVLRAIGGLVAGPGYTTDPCARVASNIQQLSQAGDSELLQEELRRKRTLCD
jgi:hypothetical protein